MESFTNPEKAHQILLQHQLNENRLLTERTTLFALANSVLLIAFAMLVPISKLLCTVLSIVGLVFCVVVWYGLRASVQALDVWVKGQRQIEEQEGSCFAYMRERGISPHLHGWSSWARGVTKRWKLYPHITWVVCAVWVATLIYVWCPL